MKHQSHIFKAWQSVFEYSSDHQDQGSFDQNFDFRKCALAEKAPLHNGVLGAMTSEGVISGAGDSSYVFNVTFFTLLKIHVACLQKGTYITLICS